MDAAGLQVLMVSTECRGLAKVGGLGDVVRDLSKSLSMLGVSVRVIMPYYENIHVPAEPLETFRIPFGSRQDWPVQAFRTELDGVPVYLLGSRDFFGGEYGDVYIDSDRLGRGPFEDDTLRFAFFSKAVLEFLLTSRELSGINALHCHDWHTGALLTLLKYDSRYGQLSASLKTLFTIHNLDYQGVRPFELTGERQLISFKEWFPELYDELKIGGKLADIADTHAPIPCFNPMRAGINLADHVNTVSPNYAEEITRRDNKKKNFIGGRGLEKDLKKRGSRLSGILNGLDYQVNNPANLSPAYDSSISGWPGARKQHKEELLNCLPANLAEMAARLGKRFKNSPAVLKKMAVFQPDEWVDMPLVVAVTRAVGQKVNILLERLDKSDPILLRILQKDLFLLVLGTGDLEDRLEEINEHANGLFVCAFDPGFAQSLYEGGDIFLMPSDFEPCGITQMIAMRYGCLPLVPNVGGLKDTVQNRVTGFVYQGADRAATRKALLDTLDMATECYAQERKRWEAMQIQAMDARFEWSISAMKYLELFRSA